MVDRGEWWCEFFLLHYSLLQLHRKPLPMCQTWISWKNMYGRIEDCLLIASVSQFNITWEWKWRTRTLLLSSTCFGARYFKQFVHMLHFLILWHNYITSKKIELKYLCASLGQASGFMQDQSCTSQNQDIHWDNMSLWTTHSRWSICLNLWTKIAM
jgi:hypothetical protein